MTALLHTLQHAHGRLGSFMDRFMDYHPFLGYSLAFVIVPLLMLCIISCGVSIIALPFYLLFV